MEHNSFTLLVLSAAGGMGHEAYHELAKKKAYEPRIRKWNTALSLFTSHYSYLEQPENQVIGRLNIGEVPFGSYME